jgi:Protein of unknown function (DUF4065)
MASQKFMDLVHYICWRCEDPRQLGATKLHKIAWFIDTYTYRRVGQSLTGETYIKRQFGPTARAMLPTLAQLSAEGKIAERPRQSPYDPREFHSLRDPDTSRFSAEDIAIIDAVIADVCAKFSATSISEYSHDQIWEAAEIGEEIPLYAVLAGIPAEVTDEDMAWADGMIEETEKYKNKKPLRENNDRVASA